MTTNTQVIQKVITKLNEEHYPCDLLSANTECLNALTSHLACKGQNYSPEVAREWLSAQSDLGRNRLVSYHCALTRIHCMYDPSWHPLEFDAPTVENYSNLYESIRAPLDDYLGTLSNHKDCKRDCVRFLAFAQNQLGTSYIEDISFDVIATYYDVFFAPLKRHAGSEKISNLLGYFHRAGYLPYSAQLLISHLQLGKGFYWNAIDTEVWEEIENLRAHGVEEVSLDFIDEFKEAVTKYYINEKYHEKRKYCTLRYVNGLALFLDSNHLGYNPGFAKAWAENLAKKNRDKNVRRPVALLQSYYEKSEIVNLPNQCARSKFYEIPEWCREAAFQYEELKKKEGYAQSSMDMIRSCVLRFCKTVDSFGIRSFKELTAEHIKRFNAVDTHNTPAGKNAYNCRIRKFLAFLGENGYLSAPYLFIALKTVYASKETIVVVLTDDEMAELQARLNSEESDLSLRNKAITLLGLKMGIRSVDIANLKYDQVNWETESIRFVQRKTAVEVELPMPPEVGDALYLYITKERPEKSIPNIFLQTRGPYGGVSRSVCAGAFHKALPNRHVPGSGFHVTRKTFATNLLRNNVGVKTVVAALGQRSDDSVHRYLSLDEEHMQMCSLSLKSWDVKGWSHVGL